MLKNFLSIFWVLDHQQKNQWFSSLDGLRGFAALLVVMDHVGFITSGLGGNGVWIFFVLSAFLLTQPFINDNYDFRNLPSYMIRRVMRILPMYIIFVLFWSWFDSKNLMWIIQHFLFLKAENHLWTVKQELLFYLILPVIVLFVNVIIRFNLLRVIALLALAYISSKFLTMSVLSLTAINSYAQFFIAPFLVGMAVAYLVPYIQQYMKNIPQNYLTVMSNILVIIAITSLIIFNYYASLYFHKTNGGNLVWEQAFLVSCGFAVLITLCVIDHKNILSRILNLSVFRNIGMVGYSFYLIHWIMTDLTHDIASVYARFVIVVIATYLASCLTYRFIELPCIHYGRKISKSFSITDK